MEMGSCWICIELALRPKHRQEVPTHLRDQKPKLYIRSYNGTATEEWERALDIFQSMTTLQLQAQQVHEMVLAQLSASRGIESATGILVPSKTTLGCRRMDN